MLLHQSIASPIIRSSTSKGANEMSGESTLFNGLSLRPVDALKNISSLIEVGCLLTTSSSNNHKEIGDTIIWLARDYASAAHTFALGEKG